VSPPTVSLVMPAWQPNPDWLRTAVASALAQRGCELELLVVDDGSPEPVAALLADVRDPRLRVIQVSHSGTSHARNVGFEHSGGDWIRFVDSDDFLPPESTANLLAIATGREVIAYGATAYCDAELRPLEIVTSDVRGQAAVDCLLGRFQVTLPTMLFPRRVVELVGDWDESITVCQDWDFGLRALEHCSVDGDHTVALHYRQHAGGASKGDVGTPRWHLAQEGRRAVIDRYFERHPEQRGTRLEARARGVVDLSIARGHREAYLAHLGHAAERDPRSVARELAVFAGLVARRALGRVVRHRSSERARGTVRPEDDTPAADLPAPGGVEARP
jgi:glycosyltransferase involved in cell wall biosynthesis